MSPAIIIIGAILVGLISTPLALFSRGLDNSSLEVNVEGSQVVFSFTWNGLVNIKDANLTVIVNDTIVGVDLDESLERGERLEVPINATVLQEGNPTIVLSGSVEGIYGFKVVLEVKG